MAETDLGIFMDLGPGLYRVKGIGSDAIRIERVEEESKDPFEEDVRSAVIVLKELMEQVVDGASRLEWDNPSEFVLISPAVDDLKSIRRTIELLHDYFTPLTT